MKNKLVKSASYRYYKKKVSTYITNNDTTGWLPYDTYYVGTANPELSSSGSFTPVEPYTTQRLYYNSASSKQIELTISGNTWHTILCGDTYYGFFGLQNTTWGWYHNSGNTYAKVSMMSGTITKVVLDSSSPMETITVSSQLYPTNGYQDGYWYTLVSSVSEITDDNIYGGVNYSKCINADTDLTVGTVSSAEISFETDEEILLGERIEYDVKQMSDSSWREIGIFNVNEVTRYDNHYKITAYDDMSKFDTDIKTWNDALSWSSGITVGTYLSSLCTYLGVTLSSSTFTNSTVNMTSNPFSGMTINGKTVLGYIASLAGGYIDVNYGGVLQVNSFSSTSVKTLTNDEYVKITYLYDGNAPAIDKVRISYSGSDVGISVGSGTSCLNLNYNPIIYSKTTSEITTCLTNIYNKVSTYSYKPLTIDLLEDYSINAGDKITIGSFTTYVFSKSWTKSGVRLVSTGNTTRDISSASSDIEQMNGKYNSLSRTVDATVSQVGSIDTRLGSAESTITQQASQISVVVEGSGTAADPYTPNKAEITLALNDGGTSDIVVSADNITMTGTTTFLTASDVGASGSTSIDGGRIQTGTVDADHINLHGDMEMANGVFEITNGGSTQGWIGQGTGNDGSGSSASTTYGVVMVAGSTNEGLTDGSHYVICTTSGVRLQSNTSTIYVTNSAAKIDAANLVLGSTLYGTSAPSGTPSTGNGTIYFQIES